MQFHDHETEVQDRTKVDAMQEILVAFHEYLDESEHEGETPTIKDFGLYLHHMGESVPCTTCDCRPPLKGSTECVYCSRG